VTGTPAPALISSVLLALAGTGLAACGEDAPSDQEAVRAKLTEFADATRGRQYARLCDRVLAPRLIADVERLGGRCPEAMEQALGDVRDPRLTIGRIRVDGNRANAEVRTIAAGQEPSRDIVELVRSKDGWRISSLSGASPPSPAP
jgi:hypothetical protein